MMTKKERELNSVDQVITVLDLLGNPTRLRIVLTLCTNGPMTVNALTILLGESQSVVSHHLIKMKDRKLTTSFREGQTKFYALTNKDWVKHLDLFISRQ